MGFGRFAYSATVMDGKIYVAGGQISVDSYLKAVECYDPVVDEWTQIANMNYPRKSFGLVGKNGILYAMGHHETIERYDPFQKTWTVVKIEFNLLHNSNDNIINYAFLLLLVYRLEHMVCIETFNGS